MRRARRSGCGWSRTCATSTSELAQTRRRRAGAGELPEPAPAAVAPSTDLPPSPALSIVANGPDSFAGRKLGVLVTDGADAELLAELREAAARSAA